MDALEGCTIGDQQESTAEIESKHVLDWVVSSFIILILRFKKYCGMEPRCIFL